MVSGEGKGAQQTTRPAMRVRGVEVPPSAIVGGLRYMRGDDAFWRENVADQMQRDGCPADIANDAAGRLMQWARRRGLIQRPFDDYWAPTPSFAEEEFAYGA